MRAVRLPDRPVWVDGRILRGEAAVIGVFDRGARDGGGLFETLRVYGGRPTRAGAWVEAEPVGGRLWAGTRRGAGSAIVSPRAFEPGWLGRHKTTSRLAWDLAREEARAADVDEVLLVSREGHVLEGAASNVFVVRDDEVLTPPLSLPVLPGVTRAIVLELCAELRLRHRELAITPEHLRWAEEVFVTNSVQEVLPLARLHGREVPGRAFGERLLAAYRERVAAARD